MLRITTLALLLATAAHAETTIVYQAWGSPREGEVWQDIARAFEAGHPEIKVDVQLSDWDSYWEKLRVTIAGGQPPDVFAMSPPLYPDWQSRGVLLNLQPWLDTDPSMLDGVYPVTLEAYKTPDGYFGLPRDFQTIVLYYNKDMFDTAGVAYPTPDWTWDTLREAAKDLTLDSDGDGTTDQWGFTSDLYGPEALLAPVLRSYGGDLVDQAAGKTVLNTPEAMAGLTFIAQMFMDDHSMPTESEVETYGWDPFNAGVAAMTLSGHWSVPDYSAQAFKWDIAPIPQGPNGRVTTTNSAGFVVSKDSANPDAAVEFVRFATGEDGQTLLASIGLAVPIRESIALSPAYLDQTSAPIDHKLFVDALAYARPLPVFRGYEEWATALGDSLNLVWTGELPLAEAVAEAVTEGDAAIARNRN
jgi:multiple sugar transport system substrate-binding protein